MTKAGQTCLTTCKIPMNERNLSSWSPTHEALFSRSFSRSLVRRSARAGAHNSTSSVIKFLDLKKSGFSARGGIKGETRVGRNARCHVTTFSPTVRARPPSARRATCPDLFYLLLCRNVTMLTTPQLGHSIAFHIANDPRVRDSIIPDKECNLSSASDQFNYLITGHANWTYR